LDDRAIQHQMNTDNRVVTYTNSKISSDILIDKVKTSSTFLCAYIIDIFRVII